MVANHWSNDAMVTIHRSGLICPNLFEIVPASIQCALKSPSPPPLSSPFQPRPSVWDRQQDLFESLLHAARRLQVAYHDKLSSSPSSSLFWLSSSLRARSIGGVSRRHYGRLAIWELAHAMVFYGFESHLKILIKKMSVPSSFRCGEAPRQEASWNKFSLIIWTFCRQGTTFTSEVATDCHLQP